MYPALPCGLILSFVTDGIIFFVLKTQISATCIEKVDSVTHIDSFF